LLAGNKGYPQVIERHEGNVDWTVASAFQFGDTLHWLLDTEDDMYPAGRGTGLLGGMEPLSARDAGTRGTYWPLLGVGAYRLIFSSTSIGHPPSEFFDGWSLLAGELQVGDEFVSSPMADTFIHGRVIAEGLVITPAGIFPDALRVFYYFELPVYGVYDFPHPEPEGYFRALEYGSIDWVAGVGPVRSTLRSMVTVGATVDQGVRETTATLTVATNLDVE